MAGAVFVALLLPLHLFLCFAWRNVLLVVTGRRPFPDPVGVLYDLGFLVGAVLLMRWHIGGILQPGVRRIAARWGGAAVTDPRFRVGLLETVLGVSLVPKPQLYPLATTHPIYVIVDLAIPVLFGWLLTMAAAEGHAGPHGWLRNTLEFGSPVIAIALLRIYAWYGLRRRLSRDDARYATWGVAFFAGIVALILTVTWTVGR